MLLLLIVQKFLQKVKKNLNKHMSCVMKTTKKQRTHTIIQLDYIQKTKNMHKTIFRSDDGGGSFLKLLALNDKHK